MFQRKSKKNLYYSVKYSFTSYNNNFRLMGTLTTVLHTNIKTIVLNTLLIVIPQVMDLV